MDGNMEIHSRKERKEHSSQKQAYRDNDRMYYILRPQFELP